MTDNKDKKGSREIDPNAFEREITTDLDEPRTELRTKQHPTQSKDRDDRRLAVRRAQKRGEKARLNKHRLPTKRVEGAAHIYEG